MFLNFDREASFVESKQSFLWCGIVVEYVCL